jgi:hypothetical protein
MTRTISVRWFAMTGEYIVRIDGNRNTDYFATDPIDAIETADAMADEVRRSGAEHIDVTVDATTRRRALNQSGLRKHWHRTHAIRIRSVPNEPTLPKLGTAR